MRKNWLPNDDDPLDKLINNVDPKDFPDDVFPMGDQWWRNTLGKWGSKDEHINLDDVSGELKSMIWTLKLIVKDIESSDDSDPRLVVLSLALRDIAIILKEKLS